MGRGEAVDYVILSCGRVLHQPTCAERSPITQKRPAQDDGLASRAASSRAA